MTSTTTKSRSRNLVLTRAALLDAAATVFSRKGIDGATLAEIADEAGFTRGAVHHHFSSKDEIVLAVIARRDEERLAAYGPDVFDDPEAGIARWRQVHADDVALRAELHSQAIRNQALRAPLAFVEQAAIHATATLLQASATARGLTWSHPVESIAELLHVVSRAASEHAVLTGTSGDELMATAIRLVWDGATEVPTSRR